jgi:hypothetical protein
MEALKERPKRGIMDALMPAHAALSTIPRAAMIYQRDVALSEEDTYVRVTKEDYIRLATLLENRIQSISNTISTAGRRKILGARKVGDLEKRLAAWGETRNRLRAAKDFLFHSGKPAAATQTTEVAP